MQREEGFELGKHRFVRNRADRRRGFDDRDQRSARPPPRSKGARRIARKQPEYAAGVKGHLEVALRMAALLDQAPLDDESEPGPVFSA